MSLQDYHWHSLSSKEPKQFVSLESWPFYRSITVLLLGAHFQFIFFVTKGLPFALDFFFVLAIATVDVKVIDLQ